jgi:hypothetical protein
MEVSGGCLCKAVRYRISAEPIITRVCWCRVCQYLGAGSGTVNTGFARNGIAVTGELSVYQSIAASGNVMRRRFCAVCGTPVFSESEARPGLVFVRSGTLDDASLINPAMTIWTAMAPRWACMDSTIPKFDEQPPPPQ